MTCGPVFPRKAAAKLVTSGQPGQPLFSLKNRFPENGKNGFGNKKKSVRRNLKREFLKNSSTLFLGSTDGFFGSLKISSLKIVYLLRSDLHNFLSRKIWGRIFKNPTRRMPLTDFQIFWAFFFWRYFLAIFLGQLLKAALLDFFSKNNPLRLPCCLRFRDAKNIFFVFLAKI